MEITYEEAEEMLHKRLEENPAIKELISDPAFKKTLAELVSFEGIGASLLPTIEFEILMVLGRYAPISELTENIIESTKLPTKTAESLVAMIETILLDPVYGDLIAFDAFWKIELEKEKDVAENVSTQNESMKVPEKTEVVPQHIPTPPKEIAVKPIEIPAVPLVPERQVIPSVPVPVPLPPQRPIPTSLPVAPKNFREKLELRPEGMPPIKETDVIDSAPKPLTRDEVIKAIASKRTMASDIAMMKQSGGDNAVHGYEAYQKVKGGEENK